MSQHWTQETIQALILRSDKAVVRALKILLARQTTTEQATKKTRERNGRGFNSRDAAVLTDIAQNLPRYGDHMTPRQLAYCRRRLGKYWRQLIEEISPEREVMSAKAAAVLIVPDAASSGVAADTFVKEFAAPIAPARAPMRELEGAF